MTIKAGELRHVVALQQATYTTNAAGERVPKWATVATLRALVTSQGGSEPEIAGGVQPLSLYEVKHRYYAGLQPLMRYIWEGLILNIANITPDPRKIEQVSHCTQREVLAGQKKWFAASWWGGGWFRNGWWRSEAA